MGSRKGITAILIIIIALVISVAVGIGVFVMTRHLRPTPLPVSSPVGMETSAHAYSTPPPVWIPSLPPVSGILATPTPQEIATWQTFTDSKKSFTLQYPSNWQQNKFGILVGNQKADIYGVGSFEQNHCALDAEPVEDETFDALSLGNYTVYRDIGGVYGDTSGQSGYFFSYCIGLSDKEFKMVFYAPDDSAQTKALFDHIVATFRQTQ